MARCIAKVLVDAAMPDASGLWIVPEGALQRELIEVASEIEVRTSLYPRSRWDGAAPSEVGAEAAEIPEQIMTGQKTRHEHLMTTQTISFRALGPEAENTPVFTVF